MDEPTAFHLEEYLDVLRTRKWLVLLPTLVLVLVTGVGGQFLPNIYRATTVILVEAQKVPEEYVKTTISLDLEKRMATIRQQILSRTRLERIIREYNLYPEMVAAMPMEGVVAAMAADIDIPPPQKDTFEISYMGRDPYTVQQVTEKLASTFIEENLMDRERQANSTLGFMDTELERVKKLLEDQEQKLQQFKEVHRGELPSDQEQNQRRLDRLQDQLQTVSKDLSDAETRKILIQTQLNRVSSTVIARGGGTDLVSIDTQIESLRAQLADLKLKFTDAHPDVIRVKNEIAGLERKRAGEGRGGGGRVEENSLTRDLLAQQRQADMDIANFRAERARIMSENGMIQRLVDAEPQIEAELAELTRDYEKTKEEYDTLLKNKNEAQRSASLELQQKGQQFKTLDHAQLPQTPFKPKRVRIVLFGLLLGLGIGLGSAFLAEHLDHSFRNAADVEADCRVAVLATVPTFALKAPGQTRRLVKLLVLVGIGVLLFLAIVFLVLSVGFGITPGEVLGIGRAR
jgi:polysaccharide chain length determinant protein (PEP-CTERM system associated)